MNDLSLPRRTLIHARWVVAISSHFQNIVRDCIKPGGAHLLLRFRCAVLDNRLANFFREWHSNFRNQQAAPLPKHFPIQE
jgi:hypothetical protein